MFFKGLLAEVIFTANYQSVTSTEVATNRADAVAGSSPAVIEIIESSMSRKYKFNSKEGLYFVSVATVYWIDVFVREEYCQTMVSSLDY